MVFFEFAPICGTNIARREVKKTLQVLSNRNFGNHIAQLRNALTYNAVSYSSVKAAGSVLDLGFIIIIPDMRA